MPFYRWALHGQPIPLSQTHHPGLECGRKESRGLSEGDIVWLSFVMPRFYKRRLVLRYKCVRTHEQQVPFTKQRCHPHSPEKQTPHGFLLHHSGGQPWTTGRRGRSDLPGPLHSACAFSRDGQLQSFTEHPLCAGP